MTDRNPNAASVFSARNADTVDGSDLVRARQRSEDAHRASSARMAAFKHLPKDEEPDRDAAADRSEKPRRGKA